MEKTKLHKLESLSFCIFFIWGAPFWVRPASSPPAFLGLPVFGFATVFHRCLSPPISVSFKRSLVQQFFGSTQSVSLFLLQNRFLLSAMLIQSWLFPFSSF